MPIYITVIKEVLDSIPHPEQNSLVFSFDPFLNGCEMRYAKCLFQVLDKLSLCSMCLNKVTTGTTYSVYDKHYGDWDYLLINRLINLINNKKNKLNKNSYDCYPMRNNLSFFWFNQWSLSIYKGKSESHVVQ